MDTFSYLFKTLSNLLEDPVCASEVTKNQQFSWPSLLALMQSKFLAIQHAALRTVDQLICRYKDEVVQKTFRASTGVLDLCDILEVKTNNCSLITSLSQSNNMTTSYLIVYPKEIDRSFIFRS